MPSLVRLGKVVDSNDRERVIYRLAGNAVIGIQFFGTNLYLDRPAA